MDEGLNVDYERYRQLLSRIPDTEREISSRFESDAKERKQRMAKIYSDGYLLADIKKMIEES